MTFEKLIAKYRLSDLIKASSTLSRTLWINNESIAHLLRLDSSPLITGAFRKSGSTYLTPWHLADIIYYAIVASSGDFGITIPSKNDFLTLYNEYLGYENVLSSAIYQDVPPDDRLFYILFGLSQKTFWFQEKYRLLETNSRFYQMLYILPKKHAELPQVFGYIEKKYRCTFEEYVWASLVIVLLAEKDNVIRFPLRIDLPPSLKRVDNELVHRLLQDYISEYRDIRRSSLKARELYITPVLRSTQNELLISSAFLLARKGFTNLYWESRMLCSIEDKKELNLLLGQSFEVYVDRLLERYLQPNKFQRLKPRQDRKRADFVLFTSSYIILVEQKFAMLNIAQYDLQFNLTRVDRWLSAFVQAARQLEQTVDDFRERDKTIIKLILFFDNLSVADGLIKERALKISSSDPREPVSMENLFMISISELERIVQILGNDEALAERIVAEKIMRQQNKDYSSGVEFEQIMDQMSAARNEYIASMSPIRNNLV